MFASLIGSIAIACAVVFGGAVSNAKQEQADFGAETISVKGAYYDPNGEYGTSPGLYNYSSVDISIDSQVVAPGGFFDNSEENWYGVYLPEGLSVYRNGVWFNRSYPGIPLNVETGYIWVFDDLPDSCYYDSNNVAFYGNSANYLYFYGLGTISEEYYGQQFTNMILPNSNPRDMVYSPASILDRDAPFWWESESDAQLAKTTFETFDFYLDGVLTPFSDFLDLSVRSEDDGYVFTYNVQFAENTHYVWVFEHQEAVPEEVNIVGDIAEGLTGGIVPIAEGLGSGFQDLMRNIFLVGHVDAATNQYVVDGLSTFGIVVVCFAGLALALGLSRWIVNFVGSLGARDR